MYWLSIVRSSNIKSHVMTVNLRNKATPSDLLDWALFLVVLTYSDSTLRILYNDDLLVSIVLYMNQKDVTIYYYLKRTLFQFAYKGQTIPSSKMWGIDNRGIGDYLLPPS